MKKILLYLLIILAYNSYAQLENEPDYTALPQVIPPSPTVANLMVFEEVPVDYYTGQPDISIPFFSKKLSGDLNLNVGLSYSTSGIKINNRSGWVGTGWNLEAGGVIARTVRGLPDEKRKGHGNPRNGTGIFHNADFWNFESLNNPQRDEFMWNSNGSPGNKYDYEPDLFQFNFLGITGRFVIIKDQFGNLEAKKLTPNPNIKIIINYNDLTYELLGFTILDTNGNKYTFDVIEKLRFEPFIAVQYINNNQAYQGQGQQMTYTTSWFLSKIETPNDQLLANFDYKDANEQFTNVDITTNEIINPPSNWNDMKINPYNPSVLPPLKSLSYLTTSGNTKKLSKITFRDNSFIDFNTSNSHPETGGAILESVILNNGFNEIKRFKLVHEMTDRLWLVDIDEIYGFNRLHYHLDYIDKDNLPPYDSPTDNWGYNPSPETIISNSTCNRKPFDKKAILKGLLHKISYPTGGVKEFIFEHNTITYQSKEQPLSGNSAIELDEDYYKLNNPDNWQSGGGVQFSFNSTNTNSASNPNVIPETFDVPLTQEIVFKRSSFNIDIRRWCSDDNEVDILWNSLIRIKGINPGNNYLNNIRFDKEEVRFEIPKGMYEVQFIFLSLNRCVTMDVNICFNIKTFKRDFSKFIYGGGVRIKEINFKDEPLQSFPTKRTSYKYTDPTDKYKSSGAIDGDINGIFGNYTSQFRRLLFNTEEICYPETLASHTLRFSTYTKLPLVELTKGQYIGYKTVHVIEENNGFTRYTYSSAQDYANPRSVFIYPFAPPRNIDYKRGVLLKKEVFQDPVPTGNPFNLFTEKMLYEEVNEYEFTQEAISPSYKLYSFENCVWKVFYNRYSSYINRYPNNRLEQCASGSSLFPTCIFDCIRDYENCAAFPYFFLSNPLESTWVKLTQTTTKEYSYDSSNNISIVENLHTYVYDNSNYQVKQHNILNLSGGSDERLQTKYFYPTSSHPVYGYNDNQLISLNKVNEVLGIEEVKNGVLRSAVQNKYETFSSNQVLPAVVKTLKTNTSNIIGFPDLDALEDRIIYHRYDNYDNPLEVSKADGTRISYIWGYNQSYPVAKIGNAKYSDIQEALGIGFSVPNGLSSSQETALRNLPNTMVTTYTYAPMIGVTSITDPKGNTIYYQYDEFNRLKHVKDKDGNILSKNEYNYANQN